MTTAYADLLLMLMHKSKRIMLEEKLLMQTARATGRLKAATQHYNRMRLHGMRILRINTKLQTA